jgi:hypothetical protein
VIDQILADEQVSSLSTAKHQDILEFMFEFSTRDTFGRASGVIKSQNSLNRSLKAV